MSVSFSSECSFHNVFKKKLAKEYFFLVQVSKSLPFSYFSFLYTHICICVYLYLYIIHKYIYVYEEKSFSLTHVHTVHLKMMPHKYLGKSDIPTYSKVVNKLNSGIYYK